MPRSCERTHAWISAALDGELSDLEAAAVDAHLARCAACAAYRAEVTEVTERLRATPLVMPQHAFVLPARRRPALRTLQVAAAAAAVVLGAALGTALAPRSGQSGSVGPQIQSTLPDLTRELTFVPPQRTVLPMRARIRV